MLVRVLIGLVAAAAAAVVIPSVPDLRRYLRMRRM